MTATGGPRLAIVVPTRDRKEILLHTLSRLAEIGPETGVELLVVDDGSQDGTPESVESIAFPSGWNVEVIRREAAGPAAARNAGIAASSAPAILFLGDDSIPAPGLLEAHLGFHTSHPEDERAMLGLVRPCPPLDGVDLQRWLHEEGTQFGYSNLKPGALVPPTCFWTSNVSAKRALLNQAGGFDESFGDAACEDAELGLRLARQGMELVYRDDALTFHFHPTDLKLTLGRMSRVGISYRRLVELAPEMAAPNLPGVKHRLKSLVLEVRCRVHRRSAASPSTWKFLCDEALREAYWGWEVVPRRQPEIGHRLAGLALKRPEANPPLDVSPGPIPGHSA